MNLLYMQRHQYRQKARTLCQCGPLCGVFVGLARMSSWLYQYLELLLHSMWMRIHHTSLCVFLCSIRMLCLYQHTSHLPSLSHIFASTSLMNISRCWNKWRTLMCAMPNALWKLTGESLRNRFLLRKRYRRISNLAKLFFLSCFCAFVLIVIPNTWETHVKNSLKYYLSGRLCRYSGSFYTADLSDPPGTPKKKNALRSDQVDFKSLAVYHTNPICMF